MNPTDLQEIKLELDTLLACATTAVASKRLSGNAVKEAFAKGERFAIEHILAIVEDKIEALKVRTP